MTGDETMNIALLRMKAVTKTYITSLLCLCLFGSLIEDRSYSQLRWFDEYSQVTLQQERLHLDNFAYYLQKNSDWVGYVGFYVSKTKSIKTGRLRAERAKEYIVKTFKIPKSSIKIVYLGREADDRFILQPRLISESSPFQTK